MRKYCVDCVKKHLGSAAVLDEEVVDGYPGYDIYVLGNLDQAAQECRSLNKDLAEIIRLHRIKWTSDHHYVIPYESLGQAVSCVSAYWETGEFNVISSGGVKPGETLDLLISSDLYKECTSGLDLDPTGKPIPVLDTRDVF